MVCPRMKTPAREVHHVTIRQALQCDNPSCVCHKPNGRLHCPAHADTTPSLSVNEKDGKIFVKDFGGYDQDRAIAALRSPPPSAPGAIFPRAKWQKNEKEKK